MPKAGARTTTQLVAPGNVFVAPKAPKDHNLLGFQMNTKSSKPPLTNQGGNQIGLVEV